MDNLFSGQEIYNLATNYGIDAYKCDNIGSHITLALSYDEFIRFVKSCDQKVMFYTNDLFDGSLFADFDLEDNMFSDVKDDMKAIVENDGKVIRTTLACINNGIVVSCVITDENLFELDEVRKNLIMQLKSLIAETYKNELKETLLKDVTFRVQTSQTKRLNYVKEHYNELYKNANLSHGELTYLLDAVYNEVK